MAESFFDRVYQNRATHVPDVLSCLANLSNDEVFTPPEIVNQMLDMLPQELFSDPNTKFLDPACKTGVFLREIAKRLLSGLEGRIPDLQDRVDHILHNQLYGIGITELTSLLSRRSLYCSKYPNGQYSVSHFDDAEGNIRFKRIEHTWGKTTYDKEGKPHTSCVFCGASKEQWGRGDDLETHAYEWIHVKPEGIFNMKFDVIISNPPYQLATAGDSNGGQAKPIYHMFVEKAIQLNPRFITMITPSRWFAGGWGLDDYREKMLSENHIREIHDYQRSEDCFTGVEIKGGVSFFLWDRDNAGKCRVVSHTRDSKTMSERYMLEPGMDTFIRWNEAISIYHKVQNKTTDTVAALISSQRPFDLPTNIVGSERRGANDICVVTRGGKRTFIHRSAVKKNTNVIDSYKVFISKAYNGGDAFPHQIIGKPILGEPGTCCSETYVFAGPFDSSVTAENFISYAQTKFFRFMVLIKKISQDALQRVYSIVPMQNLSKPWTDEELYSKYGLSQDEIDFIESMIRPMDLSGGDE